MVAPAMFSSDSVEWATPQYLFDQLNAEFHFKLDAAATAENAKCEHFFTKYTDGLKHDWAKHGSVWCNPPYKRGITALWVKKAYEESLRGALVVMLLPSRTGIKYFHEYILNKAEVRFLKGRLKFGGARTGAPFDSIVAIYRPVVSLLT